MAALGQGKERNVVTVRAACPFKDQEAWSGQPSNKPCPTALVVGLGLKKGRKPSSLRWELEEKS